ncbi:unnamed protein product [Arabidopsis lyrata]|uniref:Expressed protein n=1 Tax=Arabidopsis lyrata subsp. lyrata TaxID=81972 RepID=D7KYG5_ARALL|nr:expressed protein [Arabidopsis lyrata subsp. lyrata]CAH8257783.1 unnamed protein product [Arabidopsis lyrata]
MSCAFFFFFFCLLLVRGCSRSPLSPPVYLGFINGPDSSLIKFRRRFTVLTADVDRNSESGRVLPRHNNGLRPTH